MKNTILTCVMLFAVMVTIVSCKMENRKHLELKLAAKEITSTCPFDYYGIGAVDSVVFNAPDLTIYVTLYENKYTVDDLRKNAEGFKRGIWFNQLAYYTYGDPMLINKLSDADANMKFVISDHDTKDTYVVIITTDDMQRIKDYPVNESNEQLQLRALLCTQDLGLPQRIDEYATLDSCRLVDNVLVNYYTIDDQVLDIDLMRQGIPEAKQEAKQNLRASLNDPQINSVLKVAVVATDGIRYRYIGKTTHATVDVTLTVADLEDILRR